jgi:hypothetical protein
MMGCATELSSYDPTSIVHRERVFALLRYAVVMRRDAIRDAGLRELGAHARLHRIAYDERGAQRPYHDRCKLLDEYKKELKTEHRKMALECHPDRNADTPEDERNRRTERFKRITRAVEFLMGLAPRPSAPPIPRPRVRPMPAAAVIIVNLGGQRMHMGDFRWGSTSTSSSTTSGNYWPWDG